MTPGPPLKWLWRAPDNAHLFWGVKTKPVERCGRCGGRGQRNLNYHWIERGSIQPPWWVSCPCYQRICPECRGQGYRQYVSSSEPDGMPLVGSAEECPDCHGYGYQVAVDVGPKY